MLSFIDPLSVSLTKLALKGLTSHSRMCDDLPVLRTKNSSLEKFFFFLENETFYLELTFRSDKFRPRLELLSFVVFMSSWCSDYHIFALTLWCIMSQNGQTHFKNAKCCKSCKCCKIFKVCLTILGHYALKG